MYVRFTLPFSGDNPTDGGSPKTWSVDAPTNADVSMFTVDLPSGRSIDIFVNRDSVTVEGIEVGGIKADKYHERILNLFSLLEQGDVVKNPEDPFDSEYFGYITNAIIHTAGLNILVHWWKTGKVDMTLAT